jgi:deoxyribodipyrimidine photolyase
MRFFLQGGESEALARLQHYLWGSDLVATYFDIRNGMLGGDYSTKFAAWMAAGCLSPRTIYHELKKYEAQRTANKSTYWVVFELIWRDFFRCACRRKRGSAGGRVGMVRCCACPSMAQSACGYSGTRRWCTSRHLRA